MKTPPADERAVLEEPVTEEDRQASLEDRARYERWLEQVHEEGQLGYEEWLERVSQRSEPRKKERRQPSVVGGVR